MGRLRLRAGDGQGQAAALVKSSRSEIGLAWILASPPTLPTPARAVDPRRWQCFLWKAAPQALPQISLCDVGWGGPALASGGVPSLGPGQSSLPLPQIAQTGCPPAPPAAPSCPRPAPRVLAGIWGSSHCFCSPVPAAFPVGTSEDRPRVEERLSSHPCCGDRTAPRHTALLSTPTGSGRAPLPHALLVPALARGAGSRRLTPPGPCAALSQRVICPAAALGVRQGQEQCRRDGPSPSHGLTLSGTPPEPAVPGWAGVGQSQRNLPLWAEAAGLLPAGVSQRSLCLEQTHGLAPCPQWLASPPHGAAGPWGPGVGIEDHSWSGLSRRRSREPGVGVGGVSTSMWEMGVSMRQLSPRPPGSVMEGQAWGTLAHSSTRS